MERRGFLAKPLALGAIRIKKGGQPERRVKAARGLNVGQPEGGEAAGSMGKSNPEVVEIASSWKENRVNGRLNLGANFHSERYA